jgi:hypothetical protein
VAGDAWQGQKAGPDQAAVREGGQLAGLTGGVTEVLPGPEEDHHPMRFTDEQAEARDELTQAAPGYRLTRDPGDGWPMVPGR